VKSRSGAEPSTSTSGPVAAVRATEPTGGSRVTAKAREVEPSTGSRTQVQWVHGPATTGAMGAASATVQLRHEPVGVHQRLAVRRHLGHQVAPAQEVLDVDPEQLVLEVRLQVRVGQEEARAIR